MQPSSNLPHFRRNVSLLIDYLQCFSSTAKTTKTQMSSLPASGNGFRFDIQSWTPWFELIKFAARHQTWFEPASKYEDHPPSPQKEGWWWQKKYAKKTLVVLHERFFKIKQARLNTLSFLLYYLFKMWYPIAREKKSDYSYSARWTWDDQHSTPKKSWQYLLSVLSINWHIPRSHLLSLQSLTG